MKRYADRLDEQPLQYLREICEGTRYMENLIDDLLDFSRLTYHELRREPVNLSSLVRTVAVEMVLAEPERRATFRIADGVIVDGDPHLLLIVLKNLVGNAWKYTGKREEAVIEFGVAHRNGKRACFVRDNGVGFDMALAEKLFIPFQRLHGTEEFKGHGIGLATVRRIISHHDGEVWAESRQGTGTTFYFTLGTGER
jgi:light-regulated signal transduction histidine kinase (bacteriophytochrome)